MFFGALDENLPGMIILDDALCQREAEAPAAFFGGISRLENGFELGGWYAFAGVAKVDAGKGAFLIHFGADLALPIHSVEGIAQYIFDDPGEKRGG